MKYLNVFKAWWFYLPVIITFIINVNRDLKIYNTLFFSEYIGILIGSFVSVLALYSIIWVVHLIINISANYIIRKFKKR